MQLPEQRNHLGMDTRQAELANGFLAETDDRHLHLAHRLFVLLLDAGRVDPPVLDQCLEGSPGDFPANGVEAREQNRVRGLVDEERDAGHRFKAADVAPLPADEPTLHLVVGEGDGCRGLLAHRGRADSLHGREQGGPRPRFDPAFGDFEKIAAQLLQVALRLFLHPGHQFPPRLLAGHGTDLQQLFLLGRAQFPGLRLKGLDPLLDGPHPFDPSPHLLRTVGRAFVRVVLARATDSMRQDFQGHDHNQSRRQKGGNQCDSHFDPKFGHD